MLLRVTPKDADSLALMLEQGLRAAHEATCEAENAQDRDDATGVLAAAQRLLRELEPDNPLLGLRLTPGVPVYWDEILDDLEQADGGDDSTGAEVAAEPTAPAATDATPA